LRVRRIVSHEIHNSADCWICRKPLPTEEHLKRLDEFGFTVHNVCFTKLTAEKNALNPTNN